VCGIGTWCIRDCVYVCLCVCLCVCVCMWERESNDNNFPSYYLRFARPDPEVVYYSAAEKEVKTLLKFSIFAAKNIARHDRQKAIIIIIIIIIKTITACSIRKIYARAQALWNLFDRTTDKLKNIRYMFATNIKNDFPY